MDFTFFELQILLRVWKKKTVSCIPKNIPNSYNFFKNFQGIHFLQSENHCFIECQDNTAATATVPGMTAVLPVGKQVMMLRPFLYIYCLMDILVEWNEISKSDLDLDHA